jgi:hypothetical protein
MAGLLAAVLGVFLVAGVEVARESPGVTVFFLIMAAFFGVLTVVVGNEAQVRWRTRVRIDDDTVRLALPARRGYVAQAPVFEKIPLDATVQGTAGILMIRGQAVPGWDTEALVPGLSEAPYREEARSWRWLAYVGAGLLLVRLLVAFL